MFYIALCDDEPQAVKLLSGYLAELRSQGLQLEIIPFLKGGDLATQYEKGRKFDLIILDMLMQPLSGIKTAEMIRKYDAEVPIIIVTATLEYAVEGYKVSACRYILKPVDKEHFLSEVKNILTSIARVQNKYFTFTNEMGLTKIKIRDIHYFESNLRTISVCHSGGRTDFTGRISDVERSLLEDDFVRIHKSYVVSLKYVRNIFKDAVTMENGEKLPLSRHRARELRRIFLSYMKGSV